MKQHLNINMNQACSENFEEFTPSDLGGFCDSCQKEVIDFTEMSDQEVLLYFKNNKGKTCGRLNPTQLKTYTNNAYNRGSRFNFIGAGLMSFSLLSLFPANPILAQQPDQIQHIDKAESSEVEDVTKEVLSPENNHIVKGVVTDENGPIPFASIVLQGSEIGTLTDFDGVFTFPEPLKKGDVLLFQYIGYATKAYIIGDDVSESLDIVMHFEVSMAILGEVSVNELYVSRPSIWGQIKTWFK